jgi:hypothetical protein
MLVALRVVLVNPIAIGAYEIVLGINHGYWPSFVFVCGNPARGPGLHAPLSPAKTVFVNPLRRSASRRMSCCDARTSADVAVAGAAVAGAGALTKGGGAGGSTGAGADGTTGIGWTTVRPPPPNRRPWAGKNPKRDRRFSFI